MKTWNNIDKSNWENGEWKNEPDKAHWVDPETNFDCLILRNKYGALCGYVGVPKGHRLYEKNYDYEDFEVHGGLTFSDKCMDTSDESIGICHPETGCANKNVWWLGFDCLHFDDFAPSCDFGFNEGVYRNFSYVKKEVESLAEQLKGAA